MESTTRLLGAGVLAALVAGCAVGPDYKAPDLGAPTHFLGQDAVNKREAVGSADLREWWKSFDDPMLTQLVARALDENLDIAQAVARVSQSRAALSVANAALLPSGNLSGQAARAHQSVQTPLGRVLNSTPNFDRDGSFYEVDAGASWELDLFGGNRRGKEAASADYQASEAGVAAIRLAVAAQTADVYVAIRGLQARMAIASQQVQTRQRLLDTVRLQYKEGITAELQVRQVEGSLAQVEASLPALATGLDAALNALDVLLGVQPGTNRAALSAPALIPVAPGLSETGNPTELLRRRPDLIAAERRLAASNARIGVAVSEYYPKLSLSALIGSATTASGNLFESGASQVQGLLGLRWRLFDFGRVDAQIAAAKGRNAEALIAYRLAALRASQDVEDAFSALVNREKQARTLARGETSLTQARRLAYEAYAGGVVSLIEVLDADANLLSTRDARAQAQTEAARAAIASFKALGGGWQTQDLGKVSS